MKRLLPAEYLRAARGPVWNGLTGTRGPVELKLAETGQVADSVRFVFSGRLAQVILIGVDGSSHVLALAKKGRIGEAETGSEVAVADFGLPRVPSVRSLTWLGERDTLLYDCSFVLADIAVCPFRGQGIHVALSELGAVLRVGDRYKFDRALSQLEEGVRGLSDLDEARSLALTFLAVVSAGMLESGESKAFHTSLLPAAREVLGCESVEEVSVRAVNLAKHWTDGMFSRHGGHNDASIDRALAIVRRYFDQDLASEAVARQVGLSDSHFRHLFRQATRQPFKTYILGLRLEKAREVLQTTDATVSEAAVSTGFTSPSHFSRAFTKRFGAPPSALKCRERKGN